MKAFLGLRDGVHYRRDAFAAGLQAHGYRVFHGVTNDPGPDDVLIIWNRYRENAIAATHFEARGLPVVVAENGYLGNEFAGDRWYALSLNQHNGAGTWPSGGPERWDSLGIDLQPWRDGDEVVILPQRGIGPPGVAMPPGWAQSMRMRLAEKHIAARIRPHPGTGRAVDLETDLKNARCVVTWGSGAALKALAFGVPVYHGFAAWIGSGCARPAHHLALGYRPFRDDWARLELFRRLIWAQARLSEIADGSALGRLFACAGRLPGTARPAAGKFAANRLAAL